MKKYITTLMALLVAVTVTAQSAVQKLEKINNFNAFVWYPSGYDTAKTKRYPLIVFLPGVGETGVDASKLLLYGPAHHISAGLLKPDAIVACVQPTMQWPTVTVVDGIITTMKRVYKVKEDDIHLTGVSAGGNAVEQYALTPALAKNIKTVFPVSATESSSLYGNVPTIAKLPLRWYFFCGFKDSQFGRQYELYNKIALQDWRKAGFESDETGHTPSSFNRVYGPNFRVRGTDLNIYDWMLGGGYIDPGPVVIDTSDIQYCVGPASEIKSVIVLRKDGKYQTFDSTYNYAPTIKVNIP